MRDRIVERQRKGSFSSFHNFFNARPLGLPRKAAGLFVAGSITHPAG
jgi:hypothetical protein